MKAGVITQGEVDERSIKLVSPDDLRGFTRVHLFAGVSIWDYALTLAGWPADRPVWTGSCPCGPFSSAGKRAAQNDPRHLWPDFFRLIEARRPECIFGEQVSSIDGLAWLDLVRDNLDAADYTLGVLDTSAAGAGAPHIRQRLYWGARLAHAECFERERGRAGGESREPGAVERAERLRDAGGLAHAEGDGQIERRPESGERSTLGGCGDVRLGHSDEGRLGERGEFHLHPLEPGLAAPRRLDADRPSPVNGLGDSESLGRGRRQDDDDQGRGQRASPDRDEASRMADSDGGHSGAERQQRGGEHGLVPPDRGAVPVAGPVNGFWRGADWVYTRAQRNGDLPSWRPIMPSPQRVAHVDTGDLVPVRHPGFPLAQGEEARVLRLKGYGDGIVSQQAAWFIRSFMEELEEE